MTCNFGNRFVGEGQTVATVTRGDDIIDRSAAQAAVFKDLVKQIFPGKPGIVTGKSHFIGNHLTAFDNRRLGSNGTDINSNSNHLHTFFIFQMNMHSA